MSIRRKENGVRERKGKKIKTTCHGGKWKQNIGQLLASEAMTSLKRNGDSQSASKGKKVPSPLPPPSTPVNLSLVEIILLVCVSLPEFPFPLLCQSWFLLWFRFVSPLLSRLVVVVVVVV